MPIFEYECLKCGKQFEALVLPKGPAAKCPSCQSAKLEQQISLCVVSSETTKKANLTAQQRRAQAAHDEKARSDHRHHHEHFEDIKYDKAHGSDY